MHVHMLGLTAFAANYHGTQIDTRSAIDAISAMYCLLDGSIIVTAPGDACRSQATAGIGVCACSSSVRRSRSVPRPPHEGLTIPQSKHRHLRLTHFLQTLVFLLAPLPHLLRPRSSANLTPHSQHISVSHQAAPHSRCPSTALHDCQPSTSHRAGTACRRKQHAQTAYKAPRYRARPSVQ
jgi:hypothetical protein